MERVLPWLAVLFAAVIATIAVFEIDMRSEEGDQLAQPTTIPSPTTATAGPETPLTQAPTTPAEFPTTAAPVATEPPATAEPTATAAPVETQPPSTEPPSTPQPPSTTAPPVVAKEPMPHTGGGAVGGGSVVFAVAAALRLFVRRRD